MISSFDISAITIAITIMILGFAHRFRMWQQGRPDPSYRGNYFNRFQNLFSYIFSHRRILENRYKGVAHLFLFWGFIVPLLVVVIGQFRPAMPSWVAGCISILLDVIGILAIMGVWMMLCDKYKSKANREKTGSIHLWLFLSILITGFLAAGVRIGIAYETREIFSLLSGPVAFIISSLVPPSPILLKALIRAHFFLVLIFIAIMPFSSMRHAITAAISVSRKRDEYGGVLKPIALQGDSFGSGEIKDFTWYDLLESDACTDCRRCDEVCPAYLSEQPLSPRRFMRGIAQKMKNAYRANGAENSAVLTGEDGTVQGEDIWKCTTCMACVNACPVLIGQLTKIIDIRRYSVLTVSEFPSEYKPVFKNLEIFGDVFGAGKLTREEWCSNMSIKRAYENRNTDILFWVGCSGALYDENTKSIVSACARILDKASVQFSILGKEELCCGDPARRMGNEYLFQELALQNIRKLNQHGLKKIIVHCPHCFNVLHTEYPQFGASFEVIHFLEFATELLNEGRLKVQSKIDNRYTYHDPCYLGRYNQVVNPPRDILNALLENELIEMPFSKEKTFCCGAGGGNFWRGKTIGKRIEEARIVQAIETDTNGLITACPFCDIMFNSAAREKGVEVRFKTMDIAQLLNQVTG